MTQILIVEDEARIAQFVEKGLKAAGFATVVAGTAALGYDLATTGEVDLIVLDIGLPDDDGFSLLEKIRGSGITVPVIILTARNSVTDTVAGLESGADDYMAKPFRFEELLARIRLRLRSTSTTDSVSIVTHNGVSLDLRSRMVTVSGKAIELSSREITLLETFLSNPNQVLSREQLLSKVWGYDFDPGSNVVDVYVRYLRSKLGSQIIETVRGAGYRLG